MLDRSLMYRGHLESLRKNLTSRIVLLKACWLRLGCWSKTLQKDTLALVDSTADYWAPVWCCSAQTGHINPTINNVLQIMTGCLCTPVDNLPILTSIQPAKLRHIVATLSLARRAMVPGHLLHSTLTCPSSANA